MLNTYVTVKVAGIIDPGVYIRRAPAPGSPSAAPTTAAPGSPSAAPVTAYPTANRAPSTPAPTRTQPLKMERFSNGHFYEMYPSSSYTNAAAFVATLPPICGKPAHLVTISDQAENDWVNSFANDQAIFIGINDIAQEGTFQWVTGELVTFKLT